MIEEDFRPKQFGSHLADVSVFLTFSLIPFLGGNHLPLGFITIDRFLIEAVFGLFLVLSILFTILNGAVPDRTARRFVCFAAPFFVLCGLSLIYSWNPFGTLVGLNTFVWCLGCAYLALVPANARTIAHAISAGSFLLAVAALLQNSFLFPGLAGVFRGGVHAQILAEQSAIPFGSYIYHNMLGGYLACTLPIALFFALFERKIAYAPIVAVMLTGIVLSSSRIAGAFALIQMIILIPVLIRRRSIKGLVMLAVALLFSAALLFPILQGGAKATGAGVESVIAHKAKTVQGDLSTLNMRMGIWKNGIRAFPEKPLLGFGLGAFEMGYRFRFDGGHYTKLAHGTPVKLAVELGIAGVLLFILYFAGFALSILREPPSKIRTALLCSALVLLGFSIVDFSFDVPSHLITYFALTALFFAFVTDERAEHPRAPRRWVGSLSFAVLLLAVASFAFTAPLNLSKKSIENGAFFEDNGLLQDAGRIYDEAADTMPFSPEPKVRRLRVAFARYGATTDAKERDALRERIRLYLKETEAVAGRDSEAIFSIGMGYATVGETAKAKVRFEEALRLYPSSGYYIFETARFYHLLGDDARARRLVNSFKPYVDQYRNPNNPRGIHVYKIRDLEATLMYARGDVNAAADLSQKNYADAMANTFVITSARSGEYVPRDAVLKYLKERQEYFEREVQVKGQGR